MLFSRLVPTCACLPARASLLICAMYLGLAEQSPRVVRAKYRTGIKKRYGYSSIGSSTRSGHTQRFSLTKFLAFGGLAATLSLIDLFGGLRLGCGYDLFIKHFNQSFKQLLCHTFVGLCLYSEITIFLCCGFSAV